MSKNKLLSANDLANPYIIKSATDVKAKQTIPLEVKQVIPKQSASPEVKQAAPLEVKQAAPLEVKQIVPTQNHELTPEMLQTLRKNPTSKIKKSIDLNTGILLFYTDTFGSIVEYNIKSLGNNIQAVYRYAIVKENEINRIMKL
jgi:hypothetical protein